MWLRRQADGKIFTEPVRAGAPPGWTPVGFDLLPVPVTEDEIVRLDVTREWSWDDHAPIGVALGLVALLWLAFLTMRSQTT